MRVGIIGIQHESNTFLPTPTTWESFQSVQVLAGEELIGRYRPAAHEIGGYFEGLAAAGIEAVPLFAAWTTPSGVITAETADELTHRAIQAFEGAGKLDGLLVAPYGAAVAANYPDFDGHWVSELRRLAGPKLPIVGTLDLHANLSRKMVDAANAWIAYRKNPHLDQRQRGVDAARLMAQTLAGTVRPTMAAAFPPLAINIERQLTAASPCRELYALADRQLQEAKVLSNSVLLGFPYADVPEMGTSCVAVTDGDPALARRLADELAGHLWEHRQDYVGRLLNVEAAVERAAAATGPVGLLDMGDNVGGGSPGDGTWVVHALLKRNVAKSLACLFDPAAVEQCDRAGAGAELTLAVGGKVDPRHGPPIESRLRVVSLHDGRFTESEVRHGGRTGYDMGRSCVVQLAAGPTLLLTTRRTPPFSLSQITSVGLAAQDFQAIVIKGVHAPVAAYESVCRELIRVDTPGVTRADMTQLEFHRRRKPLFPFEPDAHWPAA